MTLLLALLRRVPMLVWVVAAALGWGAWQRHLATAAADKLRQRDAAEAKATIDGLQQRLAEQARIIKEQGDAANEAHKDREAAELARVDADRAVGELRQRARALAARACTAAAPAATFGQAEPAGPDLLADVLGRLAEAGGRLAATADQARIAGRECERRYDALSPSP